LDFREDWLPVNWTFPGLHQKLLVFDKKLDHVKSDLLDEETVTLIYNYFESNETANPRLEGISCEFSGNESISVNKTKSEFAGKFCTVD
jgi:hypothetical protein